MKQTPLVVKSYLDIVRRGGPGSGHFGHEGRPGEVGGSQPSDFHSSPGKKGWGRPAEHGDGTTVVDGKRTFIRGWDQKAIDELDSWDKPLASAQEKDSWLSALTSQSMWRATIIRDWYEDARRLRTADEPVAPPIESILPTLVETFGKLGNLGKRGAETYATAAENAGHFLKAIDGEDEFIASNRTDIILGHLFFALERETDPLNADAAIDFRGGVDMESPLMRAVPYDMRKPIAQIVQGASQALKEYTAVKYAYDERSLDFELTEKDWERWDFVMDEMKKAEAVRKAVVSHDSQLPYALAADQQVYAERMSKTMAEREKEVESGDPDRARLDQIESTLFEQRKVFFNHQAEASKVAVRVMREDLAPLFSAFSDDPRPELVPITVGEHATPRTRPFPSTMKADAETHVSLAKLVMSSIVSPNLLRKMPRTDVGLSNGASGFFDPEEQVIGVNDPSFSTISHETAHAVELATPELRKLGWMFYRYRTGGDRVQFRGTSFDAPMKPDRFPDPYSGRTYPARGYQSEVLSTAAGQLAFSPAVLAAADPELFNFAITAFKGDWLHGETQ